MNAKQRNAVERVRRDLVRLDKSLDNLEAEFGSKPVKTGLKVTQGKKVNKKTLAPYYSKRKSAPKSHGMSKKGGQS